MQLFQRNKQHWCLRKINCVTGAYLSVEFQSCLQLATVKNSQWTGLLDQCLGQIETEAALNNSMKEFYNFAFGRMPAHSSFCYSRIRFNMHAKYYNTFPVIWALDWFTSDILCDLSELVFAFSGLQSDDHHRLDFLVLCIFFIFYYLDLRRRIANYLKVL